MTHRDKLIAAGMNEKAATVLMNRIDARSRASQRFDSQDIFELHAAGVPLGLVTLIADDVTDAIFLKRRVSENSYFVAIGMEMGLSAAIANAINSVVEGSRPELVT